MMTAAVAPERAAQALLLPDIAGNPVRPITLEPDWLPGSAVALARIMYRTRNFAALPLRS